MSRCYLRSALCLATLLLALFLGGCCGSTRVVFRNYSSEPCTVTLQWQTEYRMVANDWHRESLSLQPGCSDDVSAWFGNCDRCTIDVCFASGKTLQRAYSGQEVYLNRKNGLYMSFFEIAKEGISYGRPKIGDYLNSPLALFPQFCCFIFVLSVALWIVLNRIKLKQEERGS